MKYWHESMDAERIEKIKKTLVVDRSHTFCGNCGRETLMDTKTHDTIAGYGGGEPGCGIQWEFVTTAFVYNGDEEKIVKRLRPDLEYWNMYGAFTFVKEEA